LGGKRKNINKTCKALKVSLKKWNIRNNHNPIKKKKHNCFELLKRPEVTIDDVEDFLEDTKQ